MNLKKVGLREVNVEQSMSSHPSNSTEGDALPQKIIKRLVSSGRDEPYTIDKERPKKSISEDVTSVSNKDGGNLVNGEAKIG